MLQRLVISPHIDDEVLGCGGTLNDETFVLECGVDDFHIVSRKERIIELEAAQKILGFEFEVLNNVVNSYEVSDLIEGITKSINSIKPKEIYIPYPSYNQDHQEVYRACMVALRHHDLNYFVPRVFVYEETQVVLWDNSHDINGLFKPNYFREIDIERKIAAYMCLKSQVRSFRSPEFLKEIAQLRGRQSGKKYAESFQCLRYVE